jgi:hypothetical protein
MSSTYPEASSTATAWRMRAVLSVLQLQHAYLWQSQHVIVYNCSAAYATWQDNNTLICSGVHRRNLLWFIIAC